MNYSHKNVNIVGTQFLGKRKKYWSRETNAIEPIFFSPYLNKTIWGGSSLSERFAKASDATATIGESWEFSDIAACQSHVRNGVFSGLSLSELYSRYPQIFGTDSPRFPFLIKLIDANEWLSVQIHGPDSETESGKCEAWIVLDARPGAKLIMGDKLGPADDLQQIIKNGNLHEYLLCHDACPGDTFFVPPGTIHAIGRGLLVYEIQQPSNTTYRIFDSTAHRELHIEQACAAYDRHSGYGRIPARPLSDNKLLLLDCPYFKVAQIDAEQGAIDRIDAKFACYTALAAGSILSHGMKWQYGAGDSFLLPAGFGSCSFSGGRLLKAYT